MDVSWRLSERRAEATPEEIGEKCRPLEKTRADAGPWTGSFDSHALVSEHRTERSF